MPPKTQSTLNDFGFAATGANGSADLAGAAAFDAAVFAGGGGGGRGLADLPPPAATMMAMLPRLGHSAAGRQRPTLSDDEAAPPRRLGHPAVGRERPAPDSDAAPPRSRARRERDSVESEEQRPPFRRGRARHAASGSDDGDLQPRRALARRAIEREASAEADDDSTYWDGRSAGDGRAADGDDYDDAGQHAQPAARRPARPQPVVGGAVWGASADDARLALAGDPDAQLRLAASQKAQQRGLWYTHEEGRCVTFLTIVPQLWRGSFCQPTFQHKAELDEAIVEVWGSAIYQEMRQLIDLQVPSQLRPSALEGEPGRHVVAERYLHAVTAIVAVLFGTAATDRLQWSKAALVQRFRREREQLGQSPDLQRWAAALNVAALHTAPAAARAAPERVRERGGHRGSVARREGREGGRGRGGGRFGGGYRQQRSRRDFARRDEYREGRRDRRDERRDRRGDREDRADRRGGRAGGRQKRRSASSSDED